MQPHVQLTLLHTCNCPSIWYIYGGSWDVHGVSCESFHSPARRREHTFEGRPPSLRHLPLSPQHSYNSIVHPNPLRQYNSTVRVRDTNIHTCGLCDINQAQPHPLTYLTRQIIHDLRVLLRPLPALAFQQLLQWPHPPLIVGYELPSKVQPTQQCHQILGTFWERAAKEFLQCLGT